MSAEQRPSIEGDEVDFDTLSLRVGSVFKPSIPIDERSLFRGRLQQIRRVVDTVGQRGQHAMLFGERGVGKTSLANVLADFLADDDVVAPRVNCEASDTFDTVWRKVFGRIELSRAKLPLGFMSKPSTSIYAAADLLEDAPITPETVVRILQMLAEKATPVVVVDEFDRLQSEPRRAFADLVKSLSDHGVDATVVLVGVADSVDSLLADHESVGRAIVQIHLPRMSNKEISEILVSGVRQLGMTIDNRALARIVLLSQGLPHYAHLMGLHASRMALDHQSMRITTAMVQSAISQAIEDAQHSIRTAYAAGVHSARKDNLFAAVLLACAMAGTDETGYFAAQDVRTPMRMVTGKLYDIPAFAQHLDEFSSAKRGNLLRKTGEKRRYRYRFSDPLMQPYVVMQGMGHGVITEEILAKLTTDHA